MKISVSRDGVEIGRWTEEQILIFYKEKLLAPTDHYWMEGMSEWKELGTLIKLSPIFCVSRGGEEIGEWNEEQLRLFYTEHLLISSDHYWTEGMSKWNELGPFLKTSPKPLPVKPTKPSTFELQHPVQSIGLSTSGSQKKKDWRKGAMMVGLVGFIFLDVSWFLFRTRPAPDQAVPVPSFIAAPPPKIVPAASTNSAVLPPKLVATPVLAPAVKSLDDQLDDLNKTINSGLPKMLDGDTRFDSCSLDPNRALHYHLTIIKNDLTSDSIQFKAAMRNSILTIYRTRPELKLLRDNGLIYDCDYYDVNGDLFATVEIGPTDLK